VSSSVPATRFPTFRLSKDQPAAKSLSEESAPVVPAEVSDEALVIRICGEDREALGILFRRYFRLVHGIGRRVLRDNAEAEDLVQEIFLYVARKPKLYDPIRGSVRTWLLQTTYYKALVRRSQLHSRSHWSGIDLEGTEAKEVADPSPPAYERSGEGLFGRGGWRDLVSSLTEDQWETIKLHFFEGYTFAEIAAQRNEPLGNVRNHYYRGIEKLRKQILASKLRADEAV
jgi:RNA polymerase sigma-70 factor, ECF subfamily